jgi:hypothetical protein
MLSADYTPCCSFIAAGGVDVSVSSLKKRKTLKWMETFSIIQLLRAEKTLNVLLDDEWMSLFLLLSLFLLKHTDLKVEISAISHHQKVVLHPGLNSLYIFKGCTG